MKRLLVLPHPPPAIRTALLEHTCELASALPHVAGAQLLAREESPDGLVVARQHWRARAQVPELLAPHLEPGIHEWMLELAHRLDAPEVRWEAWSCVVQVPGRCRGQVEFASALGGTGTALSLDCEIPGRNHAVRLVMEALVERHWRALAQAAAAHAESLSELPPAIPARRNPGR
jgi:hypothetical protein